MKPVEFHVPRTDRAGGTRLGYCYNDIGDLSAQLGGLSLIQMLQRLGEFHPQTVDRFFFIGLKHYDRAMTLEKAQTLIGNHLDKDGRLADVTTWIFEGLDINGIARTRRVEAEEDQEDPSGAAEVPPQGPTRSRMQNADGTSV